LLFVRRSYAADGKHSFSGTGKRGHRGDRVCYPPPAVHGLSCGRVGAVDAEMAEDDNFHCVRPR
jgi:hypothetical protein